MLGKPNLRSLKFLKKARTLPFVNVLIGLIKKNFKLLIRSRSSALIVLLGPLLIIGLVGAAFNTTNFYNINIGAYSGYYNELSLSVVDELKDKNFNVWKAADKESCISKVKRGEMHVCAVFPDDMKIGSEDSVKFYVDKTRMNLVWIIIDSISSKVSTRTSELSRELTGTLLSTLDETKAKISERESAVSEAISSNLEINKEVEEFKKDLGGMDLGYSTNELGLDVIRSRIMALGARFNASGDELSSALKAVGDTENKSYEVSTRLYNASKVREQTISQMGLLGTSVKDSLDSMHQIASALSYITGKINALQYTEAETIVSPIKTSIEPVIAEKTHLSNMFPTLLVLIIMFIGLLLASTLVVREKTGAAYFRNFITPTGDGMFIIGDYLTNFIILALQMFIVFLVSLIFFKEALFNVLLNTSIVLLVVISIFVMLGMFIGQVFNSEETNTLGAISIGSIMLFFSSTVLPLETLPSSVRSIAGFNPFVLGEAMLKETMLFNADLFVMVESFAILLVYILVLGSLVFILRKWGKRFI